MFDSHCHLDLPVFDADRAEVVARAGAAGVRGILVPAVRPAAFAALQELPRRFPGAGLALAIGTHPQVVAELDADELAQARDPERIAAAARAAGAVAIGECGLDGGSPAPELQEEVFRAHLRAARLAGLPVVVHLLRAHGQGPRLLGEERVGEVGGVLHSYSGGAELVPVYRDLGLHFSFAGPVTYRNARRPLEAARVVPEQRLLVETDAPDQTPEPRRGQRCEPADLAAVVAALATARGVPPAHLAESSARAAQRLFRLRLE